MTYQYTFIQWLLFFFIYCFLGWVWESCYVSIKKREWINRGFLHGPMLPIYGSGAIIVLLCTIGVRDQVILIFIFGMTGATILEYVTGACMERLFRVRYWDYSHMPLNLKGYICLPVSLGWGVFSVLLVRVIHVPIENAVLQIPERIAEAVTVLCSSAFAADFTLSFGEAMDLRDMLIRLSDSNEKIQRLQKRLEVVSAFAEDGLMQYQMKREERKMSRKEFLEGMIERQRENRRMMLVELIDRVNESIDAGLEKREELQKIKTQIEQEFKNIGSLTNRAARRSARLLHRNPNTVSKRYAEALKQVQEMLKKKK
ncbi:MULTISPECIES: putative ABC transporter permease [Oscillospiraceae]|uniref:putative ABC transporter permease n=1 Tax=Oscillospiraceae TaxID=216572 RepID=UPI001FAA66D2|nr:MULTISPECIES: putative ABC transporter permease [Oscillospiraceae]